MRSPRRPTTAGLTFHAPNEAGAGETPRRRPGKFVCDDRAGAFVNAAETTDASRQASPPQDADDVSIRVRKAFLG